jgi:hypothetical protein
MASKTQTNGFDGGMNKDLAECILPANKYRDALNFRLITTKGGTTGNLENVKGNRFILSSVDPTKIVDGNIIGGCEIRDAIILFVTENTTIDPASEGLASRIYKITLDLSTELQTSFTLLYDDSLNYDGSKLNFSTRYPIKVIARYETPHIQKVYFTDGYNNLRYANVATNLTVSGETYDISTNKYMTVDKFEYLSKFTFSKPILKNIVGGKINTGMIAYAYQLYVMNGAETAFSALSDPISVVSDNDFLQNTLLYKGDKDVVNSGKGFTLEIDNTNNSGFNRLRLVRIQYSYLNSVPEITICNEISISTVGNTIQVTDVGDSLGTLTVDEFNLTSTELFNCQDIASKYNILFAANIEEKDFIVDPTWDVRAVRFKFESTATVQDSEQGAVTILKDLSNWTDYVLDHDGINEFNDPSHDGDYAYRWAYQANGLSLGAEGLNVKIDFATETIVLDSSNSDTTFYATPPSDSTDLSYSNYASPWKGGKLSWQRDEVYRLFVVFGNERGQEADPKWICDLRMPSLHEDGYSNLAQIDGSTITTDRLYPIIWFKSFPSNATYAQIYRVKRERPDRSIVTQALAIPTIPSIIPDVYMPGSASLTLPTTDGVELVKLVSPEILINKNISKQAGDYLEVVTHYPNSGDVAVSDIDTSGILSERIIKLKNNSRLPFSNDQTTSITDAISVMPSSVYTDYITLGNKNYCNYSQMPDGSILDISKGCSGLLVNYTSTGWVAESDKYVIVNYKSNVYGSQYGGNTYEERMLNASIPCSDVILSTSIDEWLDIPYGDTFINYFDVSTFLLDLTAPLNEPVRAKSEVVYVPLESSINCDLRYDESSAHVTQGNVNAELRQEYAGTHLLAKTNTDNYTYTQQYNLYSYNTVYSQPMNIKSAISLSIDKILETKFDTMVKASNKKSNGEITDSWTKFGVNEYIEVDSISGPLYALFMHNDTLYYFQEKGFGELSVNNRSVIQDNTTNKLVLGTGGVLDRFDYVSTSVGCKDKFSLCDTEFSLYWYDRINNNLVKYAYIPQTRRYGITKISITDGMQSWLNDNIKSTHSVIAFSDEINNEVLYTFFDLDTPANNLYTLSRSENSDSFISFYSITPNIYIPYKNRYLTTDTTNRDYLFLNDSNIGSRCNFYSLPGETQNYYSSTLKLLVNQEHPNTKVFDNISFISNCYDSNDTELYNQTIDTIRCYTDYQNSDWVDLVYGTNIMHRERSWTLDVPRNVVKTNYTSNSNIFTSDLTDTTRLFRERLRDKYMVVDLVYNNSAARDRFVLDSFNCKYRISAR